MHHRTTRQTVAAALVVLTPFVAAACGEDDVDTPADNVTTTEAMSEDTMKDGDTMTDDTMKDGDAMTDDTMKDGDAMTDDSMKDEGQ